MLRPGLTDSKRSDSKGWRVIDDSSDYASRGSGFCMGHSQPLLASSITAAGNSSCFDSYFLILGKG